MSSHRFGYVRAAIGLAFCWTVGETLCALPDPLAYGNSLGARSQETPDLGQGLLALDEYLNQLQESGPVAIVYSGHYNPEHIGSRARAIDSTGSQSPLDGFRRVAISSGLLRNAENSDLLNSQSEADQAVIAFYRSTNPSCVLASNICVFDAEPFNDSFRSDAELKPGSVEQSGAVPAESKQPLDLPTLNDAAGIKDLSVSSLLHVLLLHGPGPTGLEYPTTGEEALRILTDDRLATAHWGESPLVRTRYGVRYRLSNSVADGNSRLGETHRDQCLCTFSQIGLSLDHPMVVDGENLSLRSLLDESVAGFTFHQGEFAWTAQAYANYLCPERSWTDRFGKATSFSQLLNHVMDRGFAGQSCAGLHVAQTVLVLVKADDRWGLLDRPTRVRARRFLADTLAALYSNQTIDGNWDNSWNSAPAEAGRAGPTFRERFLVTGHVVEMFEQLPTVPEAKASRARSWLKGALLSDDFRNERISICPLTHALRAASQF